MEEALVTGNPGAFQTRDQRRSELGFDIVAAAYLRGDFMLSSGAPSTYYFDKYLFETKPTILRRLASLLAPMVPSGVDRLAGPELSAVPVTVALALETGLPYVITRRDTARSTGSLVGEVHPDERVLLLEDVISSGRRVSEAAQQLRKVGADVIGVIAVVDRLQGAAEALAADGLPLNSLFTVDELLVEGHRNGQEQGNG
jgi:orotate phosphoribosyltransferase